MKKNKIILCPKCNRNELHSDKVMNALSRIDNETYICNDCAYNEAMFDLELELLQESRRLEK